MSWSGTGWQTISAAPLWKGSWKASSQGHFSKSIQPILDFVSQQSDKSREELRRQLETGVSTSLLACQSATQARNSSSMVMRRV